MEDRNDEMEQMYRERHEALMASIYECWEKGVSGDALRTLCFETGVSWKDFMKGING